MGVPTYRFKLAAFALSCALAGLAGGIHGVFVSYVTVSEIFSNWMAVYVTLMAALGGTRHWLGPAFAAAAVTVLLYAFPASDYAIAGKAFTGLVFILVILFLPGGLLGRFAQRKPLPRVASTVPAVAPRTGGGEPLLVVRDVAKAFKGVQALAGVALEVRCGEILGLGGPNGSGQSTLINVVSGQYRADAGSIVFEGRELSDEAAHRIARAGIARTYQIPRPFTHLTLLDNAPLPPTFAKAVTDPAAPAAQSWLSLDLSGL